MTELKETVRDLIKSSFKGWVNSPLEYEGKIEDKEDTIVARIEGDVKYCFEEEEDEDEDEESHTLQQLKKAGVTPDSVAEFVSNFDNWKLDLDDELELEDYEAEESFELDMMEHTGAYPEAIARAKASGKEPVLLQAWIEEFVDNYDIRILINTEPTEVLSWALHQD
ncbi:MAG: hypothetical protein ACXQTI_03870 [Candidatus Nezhaarchaeales archaeon]